MPYYFFSGVLFCAAMLVKQNGALFALFGGLAVISHHLLGENRNWRKDFVSGLIYSAGVIIPLVLTLILMFMNSALDEFIYWIYNHAKDHYVTSIEWEPTGKQMLNSAWTRISKNHYLLFLLAILGFVATAFTKLNLHRKSMIFCFAILSFAAITPGLRLYGHYWIFLMPAVALLIGVAVLFCNEQLQKFTHGETATTLSLGIFAIAFMHHLIKIQSDDKLKNYYTHPNSMNVLRNVYGRNPFPEAKLVGDWIKNNSDENENISVLGSEPQVYFYANRRGVSKHNYLGYLVQDYPLHSQWQREFISDVEAAQPKYFVFFKHRWSWMVKDGIDQTLFKWMNNYTKENYQLVGLVQYRSDEQLDVKWGQKGAAEMLQEVLARKRTLQVQLQKETASKNQYAIANLRNQLRIFDYQTRIYQRK